MKKTKTTFITIFLAVMLFFVACNPAVQNDTMLLPPANIRVEGTIVSWDNVQNAVSYVIKINTVQHAASSNSFNIALLNLANGTHSIRLMAIAKDSFISSVFSDPIYITIANKNNQNNNNQNNNNQNSDPLITDGEWLDIKTATIYSLSLFNPAPNNKINLNIEAVMSDVNQLLDILEPALTVLVSSDIIEQSTATMILAAFYMGIININDFLLNRNISLERFNNIMRLYNRSYTYFSLEDNKLVTYRQIADEDDISTKFIREITDIIVSDDADNPALVLLNHAMDNSDYLGCTIEFLNLIKSSILGFDLEHFDIVGEYSLAISDLEDADRLFYQLLALLYSLGIHDVGGDFNYFLDSIKNLNIALLKIRHDKTLLRTIEISIAAQIMLDDLLEPLFDGTDGLGDFLEILYKLSDILVPISISITIDLDYGNVFLTLPAY